MALASGGTEAATVTVEAPERPQTSNPQGSLTSAGPQAFLWSVCVLCLLPLHPLEAIDLHSDASLGESRVCLCAMGISVASCALPDCVCSALPLGLPMHSGRVTLQLVPRRKKAKKKVGSLFTPHNLSPLYSPDSNTCA